MAGHLALWARAGRFWGGNYLFYNSMLYGFGERDTLNVVSFNGSQIHNHSVFETVIQRAGGGSISSNGPRPGPAWFGRHFLQTVKPMGVPRPGAVFYAFDASNVSNVLGRSQIGSSPGLLRELGEVGSPLL